VGIHFCFDSAESVAPQVEQAIRKENERMASNRPWVLCEPPEFYATEEDGRLRGGSKLNLLPDPNEFVEAGQATRERTDLEDLLDLLSRWSRLHGITWELTIEGQPIGIIQNGSCDQAILEAIAAMARLGEDHGGLL
jgi:hypothetical protein